MLAVACSLLGASAHAAPPNDTCASPAPLALDRSTQGTTEGATDDYRSSSCTFQPPGEFPTDSPGLDVVFSFTPTDSDRYSFRLVEEPVSPLRNQSPTLYMSTTCPSPDNTVGVPGCFVAANRMNDSLTGNNNRSEEISCVALDAGTPYYLFFDDASASGVGAPFGIEVTRCRPETEPNGVLAAATPWSPNSGCFMEANSQPSGVNGDIDFYDLGAPPAGSKIFVAVDAAAAARNDYEMRLTTSSDTIGYDDNDGSTAIGSNAPIIAGVFAPGGEIYARIDSKPASNIGAGQANDGNGPYRLFYRAETGAAQAESVPDLTSSSAADFLDASHVSGGGFVGGMMDSIDDADCWKFVAHAGDNIMAFSDNNPARAASTITNVWPVLVTLDRPISFVFNGQVVRNNLAPSPGTLTGVTPSVTSEFQSFRARYTGAYMFCYVPTTDVNAQVNPPASAYPLPYQGSISINCGAVPGADTADVSIAMSGPSGPVTTGEDVVYTITLRNESAAGVAQDVRLIDAFPPELLYLDAEIDDDFGGGGTQCTTVPTVGQNDSPLDCTTPSIAPGSTVRYTITVKITDCIGAGHTIANAASISSYSADPNASNDAAHASFVTSGVVRDCDDADPCTTDACDYALGCVHAPVVCVASDACHVAGTCDSLTGCSNPTAPDGTACNDGNACTQTDVCQGGVCTGANPVTCTASDPCHSAACNPASGACVDTAAADGTACDDGNACTQTDTCQGGVCSGGNPVTCVALDQCHLPGSCDTASGLCSNPVKPNGSTCSDGNACTQTDTCQAGACVGSNPVTCIALDQCHVAGTCDPGSGACSNPAKPDGTTCSDGNACTQTDTCRAGACVGSNDSWSGVLQPVNADGSSVFKLGSTIPVKFKLTGACAGNGTLLATIYFYKITDSEGPVNEAFSTSAADTGTTFRYSASDDQYVYNLGTKGLSSGTWHLGIDLHDGIGIRTVPVGLKQ